MLKRQVNALEVSLALHLLEPLLVRSGTAGATGVDMVMLRTLSHGKQVPVIPGSTIKGMLRAHAERIARTLRARSVCEPYLRVGDAGNDRVAGCSEALHEGGGVADSAEAYRASCPACRLFGSTHFIGRLSTGDALFDKDAHYELSVRDGVAIDRYTGGAASGAKFDFEVLVSDEPMRCRIQCRNLEYWQLGWLAMVLADLNDGLLRVGAAKSRGLGAIRGEVTGMTWRVYAGREPDGIGDLYRMATEEERAAYGMFPCESEAHGAWRRLGIRWEQDWTEGWREALAPAMEHAQRFFVDNGWQPRAGG